MPIASPKIPNASTTAPKDDRTPAAVPESTKAPPKRPNIPHRTATTPRTVTPIGLVVFGRIVCSTCIAGWGDKHGGNRGGRSSLLLFVLVVVS